MAGTGPAPKPDARRRNAPLANTTKLPSEGREGPTPPWPLSTPEPSIWTDLWGTPQAVAWERLGWSRVVARYVVVLQECETSISVGLLGEARQLEDRLGLSPMAMLRLRWEISTDEVGEKRTERAPAATSARRRLKVADSDVAGS